MLHAKLTETFQLMPDVTLSVLCQILERKMDERSFL